MIAPRQAQDRPRTAPGVHRGLPKDFPKMPQDTTRTPPQHSPGNPSGPPGSAQDPPKTSRTSPRSIVVPPLQRLPRTLPDCDGPELNERIRQDRSGLDHSGASQKIQKQVWKVRTVRKVGKSEWRMCGRGASQTSDFSDFSDLFLTCLTFLTCPSVIQSAPVLSASFVLFRPFSPGESLRVSSGGPTRDLG